MYKDHKLLPNHAYKRSLSVTSFSLDTTLGYRVQQDAQTVPWHACTVLSVLLHAASLLVHIGRVCMYADGEQIAVDMLSGLSSVSENRRQEVQQQLNQLKSLAEAALR